MKRWMTAFCAFVLGLCFILNMQAVTPDSYVTNFRRSDIGFSNPIDLRGKGIKYHQLFISPDLSGVTTCGVKLEKSQDQVTWTDLISETSCTTGIETTLTTGYTNFVRINLTTKTGTGSVSVGYGGWIKDPSSTTSGTFTGDITSVIPGTAATNGGKAEDAVASTGDTGNMILGQIQATVAATAADGDYGTIKLDAEGRLWSHLSAGTAIIGKVGIDQTTPGTTNAFVPVDTSGNSLAVTDPCYGVVKTMKYYITTGTSDNESQVKASAGTLCGISARNAHATTNAFIKCTNLTAANTTPGSSTIFWEFMAPAGSGFIDNNLSVSFDTALTCYVVTGKAANDATDVAADDVVYILRYI